MHTKIMNASENDSQLFFQLINQQRQCTHEGSAKILFNFDADNEHTQIENWVAYFEDLACPKDLPQFSESYRSHSEIKYLLLQLLQPRLPAPHVFPSSIKSHIQSLKNNKAPDPYGVSAEHIKSAGNSVIKVLTIIANKAFRKQQIPDDLKLGIVTPVPKKKKDSTDPDNYRRITVNSMVGKIIDKELIPSLRSSVKPYQSEHQFAYKKGISCLNAALVITEMYMEAKDTRNPVFISLMDTSKAFDTVNHQNLLCALHRQGLNGPSWHIFDSSYTNIRSTVKWNGYVSNEFQEKQGIRQGGLTSADAFIAKTDPLLHKLNVQPDGFKLGCTNIGAIMVADDLAIASPTRNGLQTLINVAEQDASRERYSFNEKKTKVQILNHHAATDNHKITLNDSELSVSNNETHLGINRTTDMSFKQTIAQRIKTARRTVYSLMGAGLYGLNGINPVTSKKLINIYIKPRLIYGLEAIPLRLSDVKPIELYYRELLRQVQHLPKSTANAACYLLLGCLPIEAEIHINTLLLFGRIMIRHDSVEYNIIERQLAIKDSNLNSWAIHVIQIFVFRNVFTHFIKLLNKQIFNITNDAKMKVVGSKDGGAK